MDFLDLDLVFGFFGFFGFGFGFGFWIFGFFGFGFGFQNPNPKSKKFWIPMSGGDLHDFCNSKKMILAKIQYFNIGLKCL